MNNIKRGEIYYANLDGNRGSEQGGVRPVLVIQNDTGNRYSPTVIVAPITSKIPADNTGLSTDSTALFEQVRTIDKSRLKDLVGSISGGKINEIENAMFISFGFLQQRVMSY